MIGYAIKIGMSRIFVDGKATAVTVLQYETNYVLQHKTIDKDKYKAVQLGAYPKSVKQTSRPLLKHIETYLGSQKSFRCIGEFEIDSLVSPDVKTIDISSFATDKKYKITGKSKGRGFTGAVKKYGFGGHPASHGHDHVKAVGSIGAAGPQKVFKGTKMAGRMGNENVTITGVELLAVDTENKLLFFNGSLPGFNSSFLKIQLMK